MDRLLDLWRPLIGQMAWGIGRGHGSVFHVEFGAPHIIVREPIVPVHSTGAKAQRLLRQRHVRVTGDCSFWVMYGDWNLRTHDGALDSTMSPGSLADDCLRDLEGQKFLSIGPGTKANSCLLTFDLGAALEIWPSGEMRDDQWHLAFWNGPTINFGYDGGLTSEDSPPR